MSLALVSRATWPTESAASQDLGAAHPPQPSTAPHLPPTPGPSCGLTWGPTAVNERPSSQARGAVMLLRSACPAAQGAGHLLCSATPRRRAQAGELGCFPGRASMLAHSPSQDLGSARGPAWPGQFSLRLHGALSQDPALPVSSHRARWPPHRGCRHSGSGWPARGGVRRMVCPLHMSPR